MWPANICMASNVTACSNCNDRWAPFTIGSDLERLRELEIVPRGVVALLISKDAKRTVGENLQRHVALIGE